MPLAITHHPAYTEGPPAQHRFPTGKFGALRQHIEASGIVARRGFVEPVLASTRWLYLAHAPDYVDRVLTNRLKLSEQREIGLTLNPAIIERARATLGGTILAGRLALDEGIACNSAGGGHHARADRGAGFCIFNDVAVAIRVLQAEGLIATALVIDLDVHQGDGTAAIFQDDASVVTASVHAARNYPVRKIASTIDIALADNTADRAYLSALIDLLDDLGDRALPDIVFYNAGVDPHRDDRLGRLALTDAGLKERDKRVIGWARERQVPIACVIGGGYGDDVVAVAARHAILHQTAAGWL